MKHVLFLLGLTLFTASNVFAEDSVDVDIKERVVEKTLWNISTGLPVLSGSGEWGLTNSLAIRGELALVFSLSFGTPTLVSFTPIIFVDLRWYYFLNQESFLSKNSGSYLSIMAGFLLPFSHQWEIQGGTFRTNGFINEFSFIVAPMWGIKKTWWEHLTFEFNIGIGYTITSVGHLGYEGVRHSFLPIFRLQIGYTF